MSFKTIVKSIETGEIVESIKGESFEECWNVEQGILKNLDKEKFTTDIFEPCEMCGEPVSFSFSLCDNCDDEVEKFDEKTGFYKMKNGDTVNTTKHQF